MWTGENDSKTLRVGTKCLKKEGKKNSFSNENGYVWTGTLDSANASPEKPNTSGEYGHDIPPNSLSERM